MGLRLYDITPLLQPYISVICSMDNGNDACWLSSFRVLPDTCVELFVNYIQPQQTITTGNTLNSEPQSFIVSRMNRFMDVDNRGRSGCIAICFYPGAASGFFPLPMNEVSNNVTDLHDLWKHIADEMTEKVALANNNETRVTIIQQYLLQQLKKNNYNDEAMQYCLWQVNVLKGQISVNELSGKANISERQLGRRFNQYLGLSPKEYVRINRFMHSLTQLKKYPSLSLTEIAYESGYYDQAHFIHDYKAFSGYTPGELIETKDVLY